jgi:competence protein ComEA
MDLNSADEDRLASIPGIGPTLASRIVAHRASQGPFSSVEELRQVRGVGPATLERIRPFLLTEDGGTPRQPPRVVRGARQDEPVEKPNKVRLNSAPIEELRTLPGIGPVLAERILEARASARFRSLEDLRRVKGLGPKTLERLRPFATVD